MPAQNPKLAEPIVDNLITIVKNALPTALRKISNDYQDGIPLPAPKENSYYFGDRQVLPEYPCVLFEVGGSAIAPEQFSNLWAVYEHQIYIDIIARSDKELSLAKMLQRYARAVWEILYGNQSIVPGLSGTAAGAISIRPRTGTGSPVVKRPEALYKGWRWVLEVYRYDDLT